MTIEVYTYGDDEPIVINVKSFEFRTNQVSNYMTVILEYGNRALIRNVCTIKAKEKNE